MFTTTLFSMCQLQNNFCKFIKTVDVFQIVMLCAMWSMLNVRQRVPYFHHRSTTLSMKSERTIATSAKTHAILNLCADKTVINVNATTTLFHKTILIVAVVIAYLRSDYSI